MTQSYMQGEGKERGIDGWAGKWKLENVKPLKVCARGCVRRLLALCNMLRERKGPDIHSPA